MVLQKTVVENTEFCGEDDVTLRRWHISLQHQKHGTQFNQCGQDKSNLESRTKIAQWSQNSQNWRNHVSDSDISQGWPMVAHQEGRHQQANHKNFLNWQCNWVLKAIGNSDVRGFGNPILGLREVPSLRGPGVDLTLLLLSAQLHILMPNLLLLVGSVLLTAVVSWVSWPMDCWSPKIKTKRSLEACCRSKQSLTRKWRREGQASTWKGLVNKQGRVITSGSK